MRLGRRRGPRSARPLNRLESSRLAAGAEATQAGLLLAALHVNAEEVARHLRLGEDLARLTQEVFGLRLVAGEVARAEVGNEYLARARLTRDAPGHRRGRVRASDCESFVGFGEGRLMYEQVCVARELDGGAAVGRVRAVDDHAAPQVGAAEVRALERAPVFERDALAAFKFSVERARRDAEFLRALNVEVAGAVFLRDPVAEGREPVLERRARDRVLVVLEDRALFDLVDFERVV